MSVPVEFTPEYVDEHSPVEAQLYTEFLSSGEPYRSLYRTNFHTSAKFGYGHNPSKVKGTEIPGLDLEDDDLYYNTAGAAADYWSNHDLPQPTQDISKLRADLKEWGYCLIKDALSREQCQQLKKRLDDQAAGERKAGIACWTGSASSPGKDVPNIQFLHSLINKGQQFIDCVEHNPRGVQAGPVIEQLLNETMGKGFLMSSFIGIISYKYNMPQGLHQDQAIAPFQETIAPFTVNTMYIMDDMTEHNGGTLVVPGSHKLLSSAGSGNPVTKPLPPAINLDAPAGTVMMFEGRLLHGTGVNKSDESRTILVMNSVKPFMRQQELHMLSAAPEVLKNGSAKFLYRIGARPAGLGGIEGAWSGDYLVGQRLAIEQGQYLRVPELSPEMSEAELAADFGYRHSDFAVRTNNSQDEAVSVVREKYAEVAPAWIPPASER